MGNILTVCNEIGKTARPVLLYPGKSDFLHCIWFGEDLWVLLPLLCFFGHFGATFVVFLLFFSTYPLVQLSICNTIKSYGRLLIINSVASKQR
jgi:hypothetical protein